VVAKRGGKERKRVIFGHIYGCCHDLATILIAVFRESLRSGNNLLACSATFGV
jgi:hypothetical protein